MLRGWRTGLRALGPVFHFHDGGKIGQNTPFPYLKGHSAVVLGTSTKCGPITTVQVLSIQVIPDGNSGPTRASPGPLTQLPPVSMALPALEGHLCLKMKLWWHTATRACSFSHDPGHLPSAAAGGPVKTDSKPWNVYCPALFRKGLLYSAQITHS